MQGPGWTASHIQARLLPAGKALSLQLSIRELKLPAPLGSLRDVRLNCPQAQYRPDYQCAGGTFTALSERLGPLAGQFSGNYASAEQRGRGSLAMRLAGGNQLNLNLGLNGSEIQVQGQGRLVDLRPWQKQLPATVVAVPATQPLTINFNGGYQLTDKQGNLVATASSRIGDRLHLSANGQGKRWRWSGGASLPKLATWQPLIKTWPKGWTADGALQLAFDGEQTGDGMRMQLEAVLNNGRFSDPSGLKAGENLQLSASSKIWRATAGPWQQTMLLQWEKGEMLLDPWYGQAGARPVQLRYAGAWRPGSTLVLEQGSLNWPSIGRLHFQARLKPQEIRQGDFHVSSENVDLTNAYKNILQPFLKNKALLANLDSRGKLSFSAEIRQGRVQALMLRLASLHLRDQANRFMAEDLSAQLDWHRDGKARPLHLGWRQLGFYRLQLGPTALDATMRDDQLALDRPAVIPFLDGQIRIDALQANHLLSDPQWRLSTVLTPVSMTTLTKKLGWPVFGGQFSAQIPDLAYRAGQLQVGGDLQVAAFDGQIRVRNLQVSEPFGALPMLKANLEFERLNLEKFTQAFDFGRITGVLSGQVQDLRLENWEPAEFQANFYNVPTPGIRQRISQRAVENLTRLGGGGAAAALQRSFLRLFKEFGYANLGLKVGLRGERALLDGVAPARQGFYILRGKGLPRVDIIGYNREVDWQDFVTRVQEAVQRGGAKVQ